MKKHALLVGVENYDDPAIVKLACAGNDCRELHGFLKYRAGYDEVRTLMAPHSEAVLDAAVELTSGLQAGDLFVFYFAGHGITHEGRHLLLCPQARMSRLRFLQQVVPVDLLKEETDRPGLDRVLILDACRTDLLASRRGAGGGMEGEQVLRDLAAVAGEPRHAVGSLAILCSCSEGGRAGELPVRGHGLFTAALLEVLEEAVAGEHEVALDNWLEGRLYERMECLAKDSRLPAGQRPWIARTPPPPVLISGPPCAKSSSAQRTAAPEAIGLPRRGRIEVIEEPALSIESVPSGAAMSVDGRAVGRAPLKLTLAAGQYCIRAELDGYQPWEKRIRFDAAGDAQMRIELVAKPRIVTASFPMTAEQAAEVQRAAAAALGVPLADELDCGNSLRLKLRLIPAGSFLMGSPFSELDRDYNESFQEEVTLRQPFLMGVYAATQEQYEAVTSRNPSQFEGDRHPVERTSWDDAMEFCIKLTERTARNTRLPTEAEWEYACRAGTMTPFSFGETISPDQANYDGNGVYGTGEKGVYRQKTAPVGSFPPNAWGLYEMHGNVREWCSESYRDCYADVQAPNLEDSRSEQRVVRGGSWFYYPRHCRSACRMGVPLEYPSNDVGFRVVVDLK
jgi:formylglycine-generating enzyme required for sulfatase activity